MSSKLAHASTTPVTAVARLAPAPSDDDAAKFIISSIARTRFEANVPKSRYHRILLVLTLCVHVLC